MASNDPTNGGAAAVPQPPVAEPAEVSKPAAGEVTKPAADVGAPALAVVAGGTPPESPFRRTMHGLSSSLGALATAFRVHPLQTTGALLTWVLFVMVFLACVSDWYDLKTPNGGGGSTTVIATLFFIEGCVTAPRTAVTPARSCTRTQLYDINTNLEWLHAAGAVAFTFLFFSLLILTPLCVVTSLVRAGSGAGSAVPPRVRACVNKPLVTVAALAVVWVFLLISWATYAGLVNANATGFVPGGSTTFQNSVDFFGRFGGGFASTLMAWLLLPVTMAIVWLGRNEQPRQVAGKAPAPAAAEGAAAPAQQAVAVPTSQPHSIHVQVAVATAAPVAGGGAATGETV